MRIRRIKPEYFSDEEVGELATVARLAYIGLWCLADSWGMLEYRPRFIKASVFPYDDIDAATVAGIIDQIEAQGLLAIVEHDGRKLIALKNFRKHQSPGMVKEERNRPPSFGLKESEIDWQNRGRHRGTYVVASAEDWKTGRLEDWKTGRSEDWKSERFAPPPAAPGKTASSQQPSETPGDELFAGEPHPDDPPATDPAMFSAGELMLTVGSKLKGKREDKLQALAQAVREHGHQAVEDALSDHAGSLWANEVHDLMADHEPETEYRPLEELMAEDDDSTEGAA